jgi:hypothetical protein
MDIPRLFAPRPHVITAVANLAVDGTWHLSVRHLERTQEGLHKPPGDDYTALSAEELLDALLATWWALLDRPA